MTTDEHLDVPHTIGVVRDHDEDGTGARSPRSSSYRVPARARPRTPAQSGPARGRPSGLASATIQMTSRAQGPRQSLQPVLPAHEVISTSAPDGQGPPLE